LRTTAAVLLIFAAVLSGCGGKKSGPADAPTSAPTPAPAPAAAPPPAAAPAPPATVSVQSLPNFDPPTNLYALAQKINQLAFEVTANGSKTSYSMKNDGADTINGEATLRLQLFNQTRTTKTDSTLWVKADGSSVQFASGNRTWGLPEAGAVGHAASLGILNAFASVKTGGLLAALDSDRMGGAPTVEITSEQRTTLGTQSTVYSFVLAIGTGAYSWQVADFGTIALVVRSEVKHGTTVASLFEVVELKMQ